MSKIKLTCCVVAYKNDERIIKSAIESILSSTIPLKLYVVDNSPNRNLQTLCSNYELQYHFVGMNLGFGKAQNLIINKIKHNTDGFHLIVTPDVSFNKNILEDLISFVDNDKNIGLVMPKILGGVSQVMLLL